MIVLIGCSGVGKSTVENILQKRLGLNKVISYTTRQPRKGEVNGVDYHFITKESFELLDKDGFFAEKAEYNGNYYCIAVKDCTDKSIAVVELNGLKQLRRNPNLKVTAFCLYANETERARRMLARGDSFQQVMERILKDREHFKDAMYYCNYLINANKSIEEIVTDIIKVLEREGIR